MFFGSHRTPEDADMSEHELIRAARAVLEDARVALRDARERGDRDDIILFTGAVRKAKRYLDEMISRHG